MEAGGWRLRQRARINLVLAQNCAHATIVSLQDSLGWRDPVLLRAATNFEGGVVGCGENCGVVTGGILSIGALLGTAPNLAGAEREEAIHLLSARYKRWFEGRFGTSVCRERVGVDFSRAGGLVRYLLPGDKLLKCLHHTGEAVDFLTHCLREVLPAGHLDGGPLAGEAGQGPAEPHCALTVLRGVDPGALAAGAGLRWSTAGLAGGLALSGAVCGALLGGILGLGLRYGYDVRSMSLAEVTGAFVRGHWNLLRSGRRAAPEEAFARSRCLAEGFRGRFGSLRCGDIARRGFATPGELRDFLRGPGPCAEVMAWCQESSRNL